MENRLHILLLLITIFFLSACKKESFPKENYFNDTPYYPDLRITNEWNSTNLGATNYNFIHTDAEVVIVSNDKSIKAYNSEDGAFLWNYEIPPFSISLHLKYHYFDGNLYIMHYDFYDSSVPNTLGSITSLDGSTGAVNKIIDYQSVNPSLAQVINIFPHKENVLIFSNFDEGNDENILNIYNLNLRTNEVSIVKENFKTLNHLDIRNPALDIEDGIFIFHALQLENQNINTYLNVIDLDNFTFKSILVEQYHFNFHSIVHYSDGIAILVSSQNDNIGQAVEVNTGENLWREKTPDFMFSHLDRDFGFDGSYKPDLVHHDRKTNYHRHIKMKDNITPVIMQLHPEKYIFMSVTSMYDEGSGESYNHLSLFDLNDGKMLISTRLTISATKLYIGLEADKIYSISDSRIYKFSHPL